ncbi:hypothetical protein BKA70DRAFT_882977 [Coprinopsis sp. MPI-PUGE-AT-0042]|nr:hypothetical protein BKA70DRAFT_882977 [Coprinopsis sp. MPI-PUGE-AT-0042]
MTKHILFAGSTGYIGGSILSRILRHPCFKSGNWKVTTVVRPGDTPPDCQGNTSSHAKASHLEDLGQEHKCHSEHDGLTTVVADSDDEEIITDLASKADVIVQASDARSLEAARAALKGLRKRYEATGQKASLIHTSGIEVLIDDARGAHAAATIYCDMDVEQMANIPTPPTETSARQRQIDLEIVAADAEGGYVNSYVILPASVYGLADHHLAEKGLTSPHSIHIPSLIQASLKRGSAAIVGEGKNIWNEVNLDDISQFYVKLLEGVVDLDTSSPTVQSIKKYHGTEGYYFVENGEHTLQCISAKIGEILHKKGVIRSATPKPLTEKEVEEYFGGEWYLGTNARCRGLRAREIGWVPERTTEDMLKGIEGEIEALLARND